MAAKYSAYYCLLICFNVFALGKPATEWCVLGDQRCTNSIPRLLLYRTNVTQRRHWQNRLPEVVERTWIWFGPLLMPHEFWNVTCITILLLRCKHLRVVRPLVWTCNTASTLRILFELNSNRIRVGLFTLFNANPTRIKFESWSCSWVGFYPNKIQISPGFPSVERLFETTRVG